MKMILQLINRILDTGKEHCKADVITAVCMEAKFMLKSYKNR